MPADPLREPGLEGRREVHRQVRHRPGPAATIAAAVYGLLNPLPYGFFVAALIFDAIYANSGELLWVKGAAWLITIGLLFAVLPRLINLVQVWVTQRSAGPPQARLDFWLNLLAIAAAIANAFVHSRDAYGVMPEGLWLSLATVLLLSATLLVATLRGADAGGLVHA